MGAKIGGERELVEDVSFVVLYEEEDAERKCW